MDELIKKLSAIDGGTVLDVATGDGSFIEFIKMFKSFDKIYAIDTLEKAGEMLSKRFPDLNISFEKMDAEVMDYVDDKFDTVCISNSLHHLHNPSETLLEMYRVLKNGGTFIISEMFSDGQSSSQTSHVLLHHWFAKIDNLRNVKHDQTFKKEELLALINEINLKKVDYIYYTFPVEDPMDEKLLQARVDLVDSMIQKLEERGDQEDLIEEGNRVKDYIKAFGFAPASGVFAIGIK